MSKIEFYFKNEDSTHCYPLMDYINEAKEEGLDEIELIEAIPSKEKGYVWCALYADVVQQSECRKTECSYWERYKNSKVCINRGKLFTFGGKVKFKVVKP